MHSKRVLGWTEQNTYPVRHDTRLVQSGLTIHQHHVTILQLSPNLDYATASTTTARAQQPCRNGIPSPLLHLPQIHPAPIRKLHPHRSRILVRSPSHQLLHFRHVQRSHRRWKRQRLGEVQRQPDLVRANVRIGGDDRPTREVHPLPHHVLPKDPLLLLEELTDPIGGIGSGGSLRIARRIHEAIQRSLQIHPRGERLGLNLALLDLELGQLGRICRGRRLLLQFDLAILIGRVGERRAQSGIQLQHLGEVVVLGMFDGH
mmetsp:Transcript_11909/g.25593  ORF Transcript_11909/g.25593 Transcript_11909/m.25593 type:complete len:260 (+) Transcript_11909:3534-4313(+)